MGDRPELVPVKSYLWQAREDRATHRLICFPHAGAGAGAYYEWTEWLPPEIELLAVQLPGRQERVAENVITDVPALVDAVLDGTSADLTGDFSFFGHSAGALLALEVTRTLQARERRGPVTLFVSGQPAPNGWKAPPVNSLAEDEFRAALAELGGMDAEVIADDDIMAMVTPVVRAEFKMWESHVVAAGPPVESDIIAMTGDADSRSPVSTMAGWQSFTSGEYAEKVYPGGHFYYADHLRNVVEFIVDRIVPGALAERVAECGVRRG